MEAAPDIVHHAMRREGSPSVLGSAKFMQRSAYLSYGTEDGFTSQGVRADTPSVYRKSPRSMWNRQRWRPESAPALSRRPITACGSSPSSPSIPPSGRLLGPWYPDPIPSAAPHRPIPVTASSDEPCSNFTARSGGERTNATAISSKPSDDHQSPRRAA